MKVASSSGTAGVSVCCATTIGCFTMASSTHYVASSWDDEREVGQGLRCGLSLRNFNDIQVGDQLEVCRNSGSGTDAVSMKRGPKTFRFPWRTDRVAKLSD